MKLTEYTKENSQKKQLRSPAMAVMKSGVIGLNSGLTDLMDLSDGGDEIIFIQDEDEPESWYIQKCNLPGKGFKLRAYEKRKSVTNLTNCSLVVKRLLASLNLEPDYYRFRVSTNKIEGNGSNPMFLIITSDPIQKKIIK